MVRVGSEVGSKAGKEGLGLEYNRIPFLLAVPNVFV